MVRNAFTNASDAIESFFNGNYNSYSTNIICDETGKHLKPTCYSYGRHYPLIINMTDKISLINDTGYSNTTAKHINKACYYANKHNKQIVYYKNYFDDIDRLNRELIDLYKKHLNARKEHSKNWNLGQAISLLINYKWYIQLKNGKTELTIFDNDKILKEIKAIYDKDLKAKNKELLKRALNFCKPKPIYKLPKQGQRQFNITVNGIITPLTGIELHINSYRFFVHKGLNGYSFSLCEFNTGLLIVSYQCTYREAIKAFIKRVNSFTANEIKALNDAINDKSKIINKGDN